MLEPQAAEIRQELAAARMAALRHSARPSTPGVLRRAVGNGLVRLGLHLGGNGHVPPFDLRPESAITEVLAPAGASDPFAFTLGSDVRPAHEEVILSEVDIERELAAPYGRRAARPVGRGRSRSGARAPRGRGGARLATRFDAR